MKKKLLLARATVLLGLVVGIYNCSPDSSPPLHDESTVNQTILKAQRFLSSEMRSPSLPDTYYKAGANSQQSRADGLSLPADAITPDWSRARVWEYEQAIVTEVPALLTHPVHYTVLVEERGDTISLTTQAPHTRIRVIEHSNIDSMFSFVITLLPDKSYEGNLSELGSDSVGSDYWGISIYSRLDGTPERGYRYENGEIVNTLVFDTAYEHMADPDIRVSMGFGCEQSTRAQDIV